MPATGAGPLSHERLFDLPVLADFALRIETQRDDEGTATYFSNRGLTPLPKLLKNPKAFSL